MNYLIIKNKDKKSATYFTVDGYSLNSKNKNIKLKDAINVNKMVIINQSLIDKIINRNIDSKFKKLINLILGIYDTSDDPAGNMMLALNEVEKFKREVINKYVNYMNKKQLEKLERKIRLLEGEIAKKSYLMNERIDEVEYETRKSR
ncbi:MAG: hypothetical protein MR266_04195 [Erysipelotrichaceae bacterium]|nr:hypothetical protein [Erysipelotrichaceae bacterium]